MAGLLLAALMLPLLPAIELPVAHAEEGGGGSTTIIYDYDIPVSGDGHFDFEHADSVSISGANQNMTINSDNTQIIVNGDYYKETAQFNPRVGEVWSGNATGASKGQALWVPTWKELPDWFTSNLLATRGYAALYTGFMEKDLATPYKPYGATREGEVLGYDVYARAGEVYNPSATGANPITLSPEYTLYSKKDSVTAEWVLVNSYRAVHQDRYVLYTSCLPKNFSGIDKIIGDEKVSTETFTVAGGGTATSTVWDLNRSPVIQFLSGNIEANYTGDSEPVVMVWSSRTDPMPYMKQAEVDMLEFNTNTDEVSYIDFLTLVWDLMYKYGEPLMTEQEQYMLLEAYGRSLPWELHEVQLNAVRNLLCRGVLEADDVANASWYAPISFEDACTILMRVKDEGSRMEFKKFQLTTDLELLQQGFYPQTVVLGDDFGSVSVHKDYSDYAEATFYDYLVKRSDNRALFLADSSMPDATPYGIETLNEVRPHISAVHGGYDKYMPGSRYMGRTPDGWYHFRIPITDASDYYINTAHSMEDDPGEYRISAGGGYYVLSGEYAAGTPFTDGSGYLCSENVNKAKMHTAGMLSNTGMRVTYTLTFGTEYLTNKVMWEDLSPIAIVSSTSTYSTPPVYLKVLRGDDGTLTATKVASPSEVTGAEMLVSVKGLPFNTSSIERTLQIEAPDKLTGEDIRKLVGLDKLPDGKANALKDGAFTSKLTEAYVQRDTNYLVSVSYLKKLGWVFDFQPYGNKLYYMQVRIPNDNATWVGTQLVDVYIDNSRTRPVVMYGAQATIFPEKTSVVWNSNADYYVDLRCVAGRMFSQGEGEVDGAGVKVLPVSSELSNYVETEVELRSIEPGAATFDGGKATIGNVYVSTTTVAVKDQDGNEHAYLWTPGACWWGNFVTVYDISSGGVRAYAFYELGTLDGLSKKALDMNTNARAQFASDFGVTPSSDTCYVYMTSIVNDTNMKVDATGSTAYAAEDILLTPARNVLLKLPETSASGVDVFKAPTATNKFSVVAPDADGKMPLLPLLLNNGKYRLAITNLHRSSTDGKWYPCHVAPYVELSYSQRLGYYSRTSALDSAGSVTLSLDDTADNYKLGVMGISPIIMKLSQETLSSFSANPYGSTTNYVFFGPDNIVSGEKKLMESLASSPYLLHAITSSSGKKSLYYQVASLDFTVSKDGNVSGSMRDPTIHAGEPNKINDWLMWLKEAKLSDAEDILTICIIAVLQWLPRIFMFIFFLLMGLSMIASMKPWVIFCDRYFDPYKFLTAGRMDVHTIDIKKVVLCSMIALILFGFFQNGLILDIIAWCARAVTGILNR